MVQWSRQTWFQRGAQHDMMWPAQSLLILSNSLAIFKSLGVEVSEHVWPKIFVQVERRLSVYERIGYKARELQGLQFLSAIHVQFFSKSLYAGTLCECFGGSGCGGLESAPLWSSDAHHLYSNSWSGGVEIQIDPTFHPRLREGTSILVGNSGVGKSHLLNRLGEACDVGFIIPSPRDSRDSPWPSGWNFRDSWQHQREVGNLRLWGEDRWW